MRVGFLEPRDLIETCVVFVTIATTFACFGLEQSMTTHFHLFILSVVTQFDVSAVSAESADCVVFISYLKESKQELHVSFSDSERFTARSQQKYYNEKRNKWGK